MTQVFLADLENKKIKSPLDKIKKLMNKCGIKDLYQKNEIVAIKVHFGELGNTAFIRPIFLRPILEMLKGQGTKPFLTDTNTLYVGMRTNSVDHLHNAYWNGFNYSTLQTPVIIADGMRGENTLRIPVEGGKLLTHARLASDIINADRLLVVSHFKGHEVSGFGGAIKNLSMGCASREGKLEMHSVTSPSVHQDKCTACGRCLSACQVNAIKISGHASIDANICTGCARCIAFCPEQAIGINWNETTDNTMRKMAEYAKAVHDSFKGQVIYLNILTDISPACDCYPGNDAPVTHDIGFAASTDPVALDHACRALVRSACGGEDPFHKKYSYLDSDIQFSHAQSMGFGSLDYQIVKI